MRDRDAFFVTGIITTAAGFYFIVFVRTIGIDFGGGNVRQISILFDGAFLAVMGIAIIILSSTEWSTEKRYGK